MEPETRHKDLVMHMVIVYVRSVSKKKCVDEIPLYMSDINFLCILYIDSLSQSDAYMRQ